MHVRRKAITPVISIIILLLITVSISGAAWGYISGFWSGSLNKQIEVVDSFCIGDKQGKILIRNIGLEMLNAGEISIIDTKTGDDLTDDVTWSLSAGADPGLALELGFDEGNGTVARDTSGNGRQGVLAGDPAWVPGKAGRALDFDGAGDWVDVTEGYEELVIPNPSFEDGAGSPANWVCGGDWEWSNDAHTGSRSLRLGGTAGDSNNCIGVIFPVEPDTYYKISLWIKKDPGMTGGNALVDFYNFTGWARSVESSVGYATRISTDWDRKEYLVKTFSDATKANLIFHRYMADGSFFFDDFKIEKVGPAFRQDNGGAFDWEEKIVNGQYIYASSYPWHQQAVKSLNLTAYVHATRLWFNGVQEAHYTHDPGNYQQTGGSVEIYINWNPGPTTGWVEARNETTGWEPIGSFSVVGGYVYAVPAKFYPTTGPVHIRINSSSGTFQVSSYKYNASISGSPPNVYGYTKVSGLTLPDNLTVAAWINARDCTSGDIVSKSSRNYYGEYRLYCEGGNVRFSVMDHNLAIIFAGNPLPLNEWHHVAGTYDGYVIRLYYDGNLVNSITTSGGISTSTNNVQVGASEAVDWFNGTIDEVHVFGTALGSAEVAALMLNSVAIPPGETATINHMCDGRCDYRVILAGIARPASMLC